MFDVDKWAEIYATVRKHKLRTGLTAFGVFWGIFMLIVLLGAGKGLENGVIKDFNIAKNTVFVWTQRTAVPYKGLKAGRFIKLTNDDMRAITAEIPEVAVLAPSNQLDGTFTVNRLTKSSSFEVRGDHPDFRQVKPMHIVKGRFLNNIDMQDKRKIAVVGERVIEVLFQKEENPIGQFIRIKGIYFQIVGIFRGVGKGEELTQDAQTIFLPLTTLQQTYNKVNEVGYFAMTPKPGVPAALVEDKVKQLLMKRHLVAPSDLKAFGSANIEKEFQDIQGLFTGIATFSWIVSIGTIIAGIIGVGNIMLIVVKERTKEIGIRKSLGATPWSIISLIIQESIVITGIAGWLGLIAGTGIIALIDYLMTNLNVDAGYFSNPEVNVPIALTAVVLLVFSGALAGLIPATKAARVNPVEALRDE